MTDVQNGGLQWWPVLPIFSIYFPAFFNLFAVRLGYREVCKENGFQADAMSVIFERWPLKAGLVSLVQSSLPLRLQHGVMCSC